MAIPTDPSQGAQLLSEIDEAESDLERKLRMLREDVTERVDRVVEKVERPVRWVQRNKWYLAGGAAALFVSLIALRIALRHR